MRDFRETGEGYSRLVAYSGEYGDYGGPVRRGFIAIAVASAVAMGGVILLAALVGRALAGL